MSTATRALLCCALRKVCCCCSASCFVCLCNSETFLPLVCCVLRIASVVTIFDLAEATFLTPTQLLVSTRLGELYTLTIFPQGYVCPLFDSTPCFLLFLSSSPPLITTLCVSLSQSVARLELTKSGESNLPSCLVTLSSEYVFLGSRLGDSLLIHYTRTLDAPVKSEPAASASSASSASAAAAEDSSAGAVAAAAKNKRKLELVNDDELNELFGDETAPAPAAAASELKNEPPVKRRKTDTRFGAK
jgi:hypothetical protein